MSLTRIFDRLFVDQLFHAGETGETIFAPYGLGQGGYLVPQSREARVRSDVRRLVAMALFGMLVFVSVVPALIERGLGETIPLGWFVCGALAAIVIETALILFVFSRLTAGLTPARSGV